MCIRDSYKHGFADLFWAFWHPESVTPLGNNLEENFGGNAPEVVLSKSILRCHLADHPMLQESSVLELFVLSSHLTG